MTHFPLAGSTGKIYRLLKLSYISPIERKVCIYNNIRSKNVKQRLWPSYFPLVISLSRLSLKSRNLVLR